MKKKILFGALFAMASLPAFAQGDVLTLDEIVDATGMKKAEVLLMLGAKSNNHYYLTSEFRVSQEFKKAIKEAGLVLEQRRDESGRLVTVVLRQNHHA
ncbi:hypothetical protein [Pseudomarimonas salicorniae]|uniref:Uncharacterized protein n=1 Tax=Pseudomarimonas salicorniae TaxID=2933270 RepID=A0ABT0GLY7_9GAMM|nr:hypothetical protein [Lysobacter sp. CAU 1642]MCK7595438.1 hypothetical protein [Lysobacter sp. CAU 1642]